MQSIQSQDEIEYKSLEMVQGGKEAGVSWLEDEAIARRRQEKGFNTDLEVKQFISGCEFVSLGCFCGVTRALQALGLKKFSYPLDWARSDAQSTANCFRRDFSDFCSSSFRGEGPSAGIELHGGTSWGGSFWHHNPHDAKVKQDFARRIDRLRGKAEVPANKTRAFAISLNSLHDLTVIPELKGLLEDQFPRADVYLLVFIDNQPANGPIHIETDDDKTLFWWVHDAMFQDMGKGWTEQRHSEAYAEGIAFAIRVWAGADSFGNIPELASYSSLYERSCNFDGGDASKSLYWPMRIAAERTPLIESRQRRGMDFQCALPWPFNLFMKPCGHFDDEDEIEVLLDKQTIDVSSARRRL